MPSDLPRKDICHSERVAEKEKLCKVRPDLNDYILKNIKDVTIAETDSEKERILNIFEFNTNVLYDLRADISTPVPETCTSKEARVFVTYTCI